MSWRNLVDFAWLGADRNGLLALFYCEGGEAPVTVQQKYSAIAYNEMTAYVLDMLPQINGLPEEAGWADWDVSKGFFVFDEGNGSEYSRAGVPTNKVDPSAMAKWTDLIVSLPNADFQRDEVIRVV